MTILVLGAGGMLGHKLCQELHPHHEVWAGFRQLPPALRDWPGWPEGLRPRMVDGIEATRPESLDRALETVRPHVVINAIGIIKQLREAKDAILSISVNALWPHLLARRCAAASCRLLHFSTDCVFSGRLPPGQAYRQEDLPDPADLYGRSKLLGEVSLPGCLTLRTSIIGRDWRKADSLLEWFLSQKGRTVRGFRRAHYSGLTTRTLARLVRRLLEEHPDLHGLWQVAADPITKFDLLHLVRDRLSCPVNIEPWDDFQCNRVLDGAPFRQATGWSAPSWPAMIDDLARDPTPYE